MTTKKNGDKFFYTNCFNHQVIAEQYAVLKPFKPLTQQWPLCQATTLEHASTLKPSSQIPHKVAQVVISVELLKLTDDWQSCYQIRAVNDE